MTTFVGIIPARYASTRFPGKPLIQMEGKSMIQRVYEQSRKVLDHVVVATDDQRIYDEVKRFGGEVVMTSPDHRSGTDRCYEALTKLNREFDVVINIQGDEPFIQPIQIQELIRCFDRKETEIATLVKRIDQNDSGVETLFNPNSPKVVLDQQQRAIYFSRSAIPYLRNYPKEQWVLHHPYYKHIGMYGYRSSVLRKITCLIPSELEKCESLEQLRWIENGYHIQVGITTQETIGIDTPDDLVRAIEFLKQQ